jgi:kynurenine 3-monooxygenase
MRDKTASRTFRAKKKLDHALEGLLPGLYLPLYTMVSFTRIPYAEAARRARRQDFIVYASLLVLALLFLVFVTGLVLMLTG